MLPKLPLVCAVMNNIAAYGSTGEKWISAKYYFTDIVSTTRQNWMTKLNIAPT